MRWALLVAERLGRRRQHERAKRLAHVIEYWILHNDYYSNRTGETYINSYERHKSRMYYSKPILVLKFHAGVKHELGIMGGESQVIRPTIACGLDPVGRRHRNRGERDRANAKSEYPQFSGTTDSAQLTHWESRTNIPEFSVLPQGVFERLSDHASLY